MLYRTPANCVSIEACSVEMSALAWRSQELQDMVSW